MSITFNDVQFPSFVKSLRQCPEARSGFRCAMRSLAHALAIDVADAPMEA